MDTPIDEAGTTLLHLAACNMVPPAILRQLLAHGAQVDCQNDDGMSALHVAAMWGNVAAVKLLLSNGSDPLLGDGDDMTPWDHATSQGKQVWVQGCAWDLYPNCKQPFTIFPLCLALCTVYIYIGFSDAPHSIVWYVLFSC